MTRLVALVLVFAAFAGLNVYVVEQFGFVGFFAQLFANSATFAAAVDLVIALSLVASWMWSDAAERRLPVWPYLALTLGFGSLGPLAYLIHRELRAVRAAAPRHVAA